MTSGLQEEIRRVLDRQGTTDPTFTSITCRLVENFDAKIGVVYTLDAGTGMLKLRCHCGIPKEHAEKLRFFPVGKDLPGKVAASRKPLQGFHLNDANDSSTSTPSNPSPSSKFSPEFDIFTTGTIFVPMLHDNTLLGVLGIGKSFHHEYAPDEIAFLSSIAHLIAAYLK